MPRPGPPPRNRRGGRGKQRRRGRRSFRKPALLTLVAVAAVVGLVAATSKVIAGPAVITGRRGSIPLAAGAQVVALPPPAAYRVVYRVENTAAGRTTVSTDEIAVSRPFDGRQVSRDGAPPGRGRTAAQLTTLGRIEVPTAGSQPRLLLQTPPATAGSDIRLDRVLPDLVAAGKALPREHRRVVGRTCRMHRFGGPVFAGVLEPYDAKSDTYADACVDGAGLVLEEIWVSKGERLRRKVAVELTVGRAVGPRVRIEGTFLGAKEGGGSVRPVDPASNPIGDSWRLDTVPAGFRLVGRFAVVPPQPAVLEDPTQADNRIAGVTDVWVRGADALILDQGGTVSRVAPFQEDKTQPQVPAGAAGMGRLGLDLRMTEVRVLIKGGRYARVAGTLTPKEITAIATGLRQVTGGTGLTYLDGPATPPTTAPPAKPEGAEDGHDH